MAMGSQWLKLSRRGIEAQCACGTDKRVHRRHKLLHLERANCVSRHLVLSTSSFLITSNRFRDFVLFYRKVICATDRLAHVAHGFLVLILDIFVGDERRAG